MSSASAGVGERARNRKLEIPLGKRTRLYRFLEILPGALSYLAVIMLFVLSWVSPFLGAVYLLIVIAVTLVKAVAVAFRTIQGYKVVKRAEKVDWGKRLEDLEDPHAAYERLREREEKSYGWAEHVQNLRLLATVEGRSEPKPQDVYHAVIMTAYNEGLETLVPSVEAVRETTFPNERIIFVLAYEERGGAEMEARAQELKRKFGRTFRDFLLVKHPDGLRGINQTKNTKASQARYKVIKPYRDAMENKYQWCIAAVPGAAWAKKVFPGESRARAVEKLWEKILYTSRVSEGNDPVEAWEAHNRDLAARCAHLNGLQLASLEYRSSNGTDLRVGLIPDALFMGGCEQVLGRDVFFNPNIPTEEVFTSPQKGAAEGIVYSSKPLSYRGELIENFSVRFENGRAVEVHAEKGEALLREMLAMDEGAAYLGECALVPFESPVNQSGVLFYNTLFDENAACHLALGHGFTNVLRNFEQYTLQECYEKGINESMIHVDFMIGTRDLSITGVTRDGSRVPVFENGTWAF